MESFIHAFDAAYMQRALLEVILLAMGGAAVGVFVVLRKMAFLTEALQHTVFPGIAVAFLLDQSLLIGALAASVLTVMIFTGLGRRQRNDDATLALLISAFFAVGVVLVSQRGGYQRDLTTLLFGRILTVDRQQLIETGVIVAVILFAIAMVYKELVLVAVDREGARAMGYRVAWLDLLLNVLVALMVVAAVQAVGTVLLVAFIVTPAAAARLCNVRVPSMFVIAALLSILAGWLGLVLSYGISIEAGVNVASGAAIVVCATGLFVLVAAGAAIIRRRQLVVTT